MEFKITSKAKNKARKNRVRNERKWRAMRISSSVFAFIMVVSSIMTIVYGISDDQELIFLGLTFLSTTCMSITLVLKTLLYGFTCLWIQQRLNERLWLENNFLYHFQQFSIGLYIRRLDVTGCVLAFQMNSIRDIVYDEKSKRIEFRADGQGYYYSDVNRKIIDRQWKIKGYEAVFYDYYDPPLIDTLRNQGLHIENKEINKFPLFNKTI